MQVKDETVCEVCGRSGVHPACEEQARAWEEREHSRRCAFAINGELGPQSIAPAFSLADAVAVITACRGREPGFDRQAVIENADWWFVPSPGIGTYGLVVDKHTAQVTELGSAVAPLSAALADYVRGRK